MQIKQYSDKTMKIHFYDDDEYEVTDDNGVDVWLSEADVNRIASHSSAAFGREQVLELLDDLRRYANGEYKESELSDNEREMRIHLEYENRIWGIMRELRKQGAPR